MHLTGLVAQLARLVMERLLVEAASEITIVLAVDVLPVPTLILFAKPAAMPIHVPHAPRATILLVTALAV